MPQFGLIGFPLSHSFSKKYFTEKFLRESLSGFFYELYPIEQVSQLKALLQQHPNLLGLNVTIPYKQQVLPYLDTIDEVVQSVGACNCIKMVNGQLRGFNTDVKGFETALLKQLAPHHNCALVLGTGGASKAVVFVLRKLGIQHTIVSRNALPAEGIIDYSMVNAATIARHTLIINTTPLGTYPGVNQCPDIPYQHIGKHHYLFDLVYNPERSLFLQKGVTQGAAIENGFSMLEIQAEESWRIWNDDAL